VSVEREVKLGAPTWFRMPSLDGIGGPGTLMSVRPAEELETVYLDTPDLRLTRWGVCLRHRARYGWTVKLPIEETAGLLVRGEFDFPGDDPGAPPDDALDLVRAYVRTSTLEPVLLLRTVRRATDVRDPRGIRVAEVVDDEVTVLHGSTGAFRELEVELEESAPPGLVDALLARLRSAGAGQLDPTPKYVRALAPRSTAPPEVEPAILGVWPRAGQAISAALARSVAHLLRHDAVVRIDTDPEGVHQARVATRRLRSDLRTFRELLDPVWTDSLREELRWLGNALGEARDTDVLLSRLRGRVAGIAATEAPGAAEAVETLERRDKEIHAALLVVLRSERYVTLLDRLVAAANAPVLLPAADGPAAEQLSPLVRRPWKKLRQAVRAAGDEPSDEALHEIRIRAKRARYAAEAVAPVRGAAARRFASAAAKLQEVLGEHHDAIVAENWLRGWAFEDRSPDGAFAAGILAGIERAAAIEARAGWWKAWRRLDKRRLRDWM
jgi:CHAD domain-containing protein